MTYLLGWAVLYVGWAMQKIANYQGRAFLLFAICFFMMMAFLRGAVGTDTANYEIMLGDFVDGYTWDGREPGFVGLGWFLTMLASNAELAVRLISVVFFGMLAIFVLRSDFNERTMLMAYIMPAFAYQYSMNALRIGVASVILLMGVQLLRRRGAMPALLVGLISLLFHYSAVFTLLYVVMSQIRWKKASSLLILLSLLVFLAPVVLIADIYFLNKFSIYQMSDSPNILSGIGKIAPIFLIIFGVAYDVLPRPEKMKLISMSLGVTVFGWVLTQYSYAGLRLLDLISLALPIALLASYSRLKMVFGRFLNVCIILAGLISAAAVYRGFLLEQGEGETPFLPYEFIVALGLDVAGC